MRSTTSSPRVISGQNTSSSTPGGHQGSAKKPYHKRSPSSDSGTGSNTPVSSYHSTGKVHHTVFLHVGPKSGGSSDTSPPLQSFAEESSPENLMGPSRMVNGQSTESPDSLSDESGNGVPGGHSHSSRSQRHNRSASGADLRNIRNPVPPPRQPNNFVVGRKCRALYDCEADNEDELTFEEGDIILVINEDTEDDNWMGGCLMTDPGKRGLFPVSFVHMLDLDS